MTDFLIYEIGKLCLEQQHDSNILIQLDGEGNFFKLFEQNI